MAIEIVQCNKPAGWLTHSDGTSPGYSDLFHSDCKVVHRLDRDTTGVLLLAKNKETAQFLTEAFTAQRVAKEYFFMTDRKLPENKSFTHRSYLRKVKSKMDSTSDGKPAELAETRFELVKELAPYSVWKAQPKSGKTHQIRVHASENGLPIYGDTLYGGTTFSRVLLHCQEIAVEKQRFTSFMPRLFESPEALNDKLYSHFLCELDRRERQFTELLEDTSQTLRIVHDKNNCGYAVDRLGSVAWFYRFRENEITADESAAIEKLRQTLGCDKAVVRQMVNRGKAPLRDSEEIIEWTASENNIRFVLREDQGWSPGVFLDQRANRNWVQQNSHGRKVLNLFAYTAGFSVAAALGKASETVTVDTSKATLNWAKENFKANHFDVDGENSAHRFYSMDAREYLQYASRKNIQFDLIICDPPSFARSKKSVFKIDKEMKPLLEAMKKTLNPQGLVLFSCNYEKWSESDFKKQVPKGFSVIRDHAASWDYELPGEERHMKSMVLKKS